MINIMDASDSAGMNFENVWLCASDVVFPRDGMRD